MLGSILGFGLDGAARFKLLNQPVLLPPRLAPLTCPAVLAIGRLPPPLRLVERPQGLLALALDAGQATLPPRRRGGRGRALAAFRTPRAPALGGLRAPPSRLRVGLVALPRSPALRTERLLLLALPAGPLLPRRRGLFEVILFFVGGVHSSELLVHKQHDLCSLDLALALLLPAKAKVVVQSCIIFTGETLTDLEALRLRCGCGLPGPLRVPLIMNGLFDVCNGVPWIKRAQDNRLHPAAPPRPLPPPQHFEPYAALHILSEPFAPGGGVVGVQSS
mmetsp:Transcript_1197/g.2239  ORF Transcript_1197/g.2239 Transcript_1197/m.2239 type:complete len:276 (-) Transcript_1197:100-927(-)